MSKSLSSISVFCGSSQGFDPVFRETAFTLGETLASRNITLVYGGARIGLMGAVADGCISRGGKVIGVIPHFLRTKEVAHENLNELILVETMHERKMKMHDLCDAFIALPGGYGTLEELFEMITWAQLGLHQKPVGVLNVQGFYDPLLEQVGTMVKAGFLKAEHRHMLLTSNSPSQLLDELNSYEAPPVKKWITESRT